MRAQLLSALLISVPMAACGGDDGTMITVPDAKVFMDAPPDTTPLCTVMSPLAAGPVGLGTSQMRAMGDFFQSPTMGPLMGRTIFFIGVGLAMGNPTDVLAIQVLKPMNGNFTLNQAIPFETSGTASTFVAISYVFGDYNSTSRTYAQEFWASSGAITLTGISEADGGQINGSVNATNYKEIDKMTGADVAGGCTTSLAGLTFALTQMNAPFTGKPDDGMLVLSPDDAEFLSNEITRLEAIRTAR